MTDFDHNAHPRRNVPTPRRLLFDGVCVICSRFFHFVAARDPEARFRFTAVQDPLGERLALALGIDPVFPESNALVLDGLAYTKSDAGIAILQRLPGWSWVRHLRHVPRGLRDRAYDLVARNRYRLFGRTETCMIPDAALRRHLADQT